MRKGCFVKPNSKKLYFLFPLLVLFLFFVLTLLNEEFDLPHYLLGDPPVSIGHRRGEMFVEFTFFFLVIIIFLYLHNRLLRKIKLYEKQKEMFERAFYHDIHNTALAVHGVARLLFDSRGDKIETYKHTLYNASRQLLEEIETHRDISNAEKNELPIHPQQINSVEILTEVIELYRNSSFSKNKNLRFKDSSHNVDLISDKTIIKRVLGNMVKNALEASKHNETITIGCTADDDEIEFSVHNPNFIPRKIQRQIFQYSFSTKGKGRGIGTYGMKLLCEKHLKGNIVFHTSKEKGTVFKASFPLRYKL